MSKALIGKSIIFMGRLAKTVMAGLLVSPILALTWLFLVEMAPTPNQSFGLEMIGWGLIGGVLVSLSVMALVFSMYMVHKRRHKST